jgi:NAD-dependent DNA ligase
MSTVDPNFDEIDFEAEMDSLVSEIKDKYLNLKGKNIVITGKLFKPRYEIETMITSRGGVLQAGVRKTTDYLITGHNVGYEKRAKAKSYGIPIINEDIFYEMIGVK